MVALSVLMLALELLAPQIIGIVASEDATPEVVNQATDMLRITAPALMFLSLFAVLSGVLYALRRFTWPAFASTVFNGTIVLVTIVFAGSLDITAAAAGWLVGALIQLPLQGPGLRDARLRIQLRGVLTHPGVRRIGLLYLPVMASLVLDVLVNRTFSYNLASGTGENSIAYMTWATTLIQFPQGLVAIAISVAILPTLSRQAVARGGQMDAFKDTLGQGLRLAIVLIIPGGGRAVCAGDAGRAPDLRARQIHRRRYAHDRAGAAPVPDRPALRGGRSAAGLRVLRAAKYADARRDRPDLIGGVHDRGDLPAAVVLVFRADGRGLGQIPDSHGHVGVAVGARIGRLRAAATGAHHRAHVRRGGGHGPADVRGHGRA